VRIGIVCFLAFFSGVSARGAELTVLGIEGRPASGAIVLLLGTATSPDPGSPLPETGPGRFDVPEGALDLLVGVRGFPARLVRGTETTLKLVQCPARHFSVTGPTGSAIRGAEVLAGPLPLWDRLRGTWPDQIAVPVEDATACAADVVVVRAAGFVPAVVRESAVVLEPAMGGSGRLMDPAGRPLAGAAVMAAIRVPGHRGPLVIERTRTDDRGSFRFRDVPASFRVIADDGVGAFASVDVAGGQDFTVQLPEQAVVSGRIVDGEKSPVVGVKVYGEAFPSSDETSLVRRSATTGVDGRFEIRLPATFDRVRLTAEGPDGLVAARTILDQLAGGASVGDWTLLPIVRVRGEVRDERGTAVEGALIKKVQAGEIAGRSTAGGEFEVSLMKGGAARFEVSAFGHRATQFSISSATTSPTRVTIPRLATVQIPLLASDGGQPRGARLYWFVPDASPSIVKFEGEEGPGIVSFRVPPGPAAGLLSVPDYENVELGSLAPKAGHVLRLGAVDLAAGASFSGRLLAQESGLPVVGALVTAQTVREDDIRDASLQAVQLPTARSGADGTFRVTGLVPGRARLYIETPGRAIRRIDAEAADGGTNLGDIEIAVGDPLTIQVRRRDGSPAAAIPVIVRPGGQDGFLKEIILQSDTDGRVYLPRVAPGRYGLRATLASHYCRKSVSVAVGQQRLDWTLLSPKVKGRFLDASGAPVAGVSIFLWYDGPRVLAIQDIRSTADGIPLQPHEVGEKPVAPPSMTDQDGRFEFQDASEGNASLYVEGSGWAPQRYRLSIPSDGTLDVTFAVGTRRLRARLLDASGRPSSGRMGIFGPGGVRVAQGVVGSDGEMTFALTDLSEVRVLRGQDGTLSRGYRVLSSKDLEGSDVVEVWAARGTSVLMVTVADEKHEPVPGARVLLECEQDGSTTWGRTNRQGAFRKPGLMTATYRVLIAGTAGGIARQVVRLSDGLESQVALSLSPTGVLQLDLESDEDIDGRNVRVQVLDADGQDWSRTGEALGRPAHFGDAETYLLDFLPAGRYSVKVTAGAKTPLSGTVEILEGKRSIKTVRTRNGS
jgi:hypothetical protein